MERIINNFRTWNIDKEDESFFITKTDESGSMCICNREEFMDLLEVLDRTADVLGYAVHLKEESSKTSQETKSGCSLYTQCPDSSPDTNRHKTVNLV